MHTHIIVFNLYSRLGKGGGEIGKQAGRVGRQDLKCTHLYKTDTIFTLRILSRNVDEFPRHKLFPAVSCCHHHPGASAATGLLFLRLSLCFLFVIPLPLYFCGKASSIL